MTIEVQSIREPRLRRGRRRASRKLREWTDRDRRRTFIMKTLLAVVVLALGCGIIAVAYFYNYYAQIVDERLASGYMTSRAGLYAAPRVLRAGQSLTPERLAATLRRAGYVEAGASDVWNGRFEIDGTSVIIRPRHALAGQVASPDAVRVDFNKQGRIAAVTGDGTTLDSYTLEPEPLTNDAGMKTGSRASLSHADIPPVLVRAILSIEDRRFFEHHGLDAFGIGRAVKSQIFGGDDEQKPGGSTITQQLVKNTYLTPERTLRRKFGEAMLASALERRLSKEDILALYCNEIYLGQRGGIAVRGVEQAVRVYFGKALKDLTLAEAATIAGMIQSPARYAPDRHPEKARARRNTVIGTMLRDGVITRAEAEAASRETVAVAPLDDRMRATAPYFIDYVDRVVEASLDAAENEGGRNLCVYTTIDLELQQVAETAVKRQLERLSALYKNREPQAALVALDPKTGHVLAMVGGSDYARSQLNRATDARRQPGSIFKPVVYAAALENGISPVSVYADTPRAFTYDRNSVYRPANYGSAYSMRDVTMRTALIRSLNVVTVDVAMRTGLARIASLAASLGMPKPQAYPSLALGTTEVTPLEIAGAYTAFTNGGQRVSPSAIVRATDAFHQDLIQQSVALPQQVIKPSTAYVVTDMLTGVINSGTARAARGALKGTAIAGKTGTSRDGWFVGYTPNLICVVWVGFDGGDQLGLTGAESALPVWTEFMKQSVELRPELGGEAFERPAGVASVEIDPETGMLAGSACPHRESIAVAAANAPSSECYLHTMPYTFMASGEGAGYYDDSTAVETTATLPAPASYDAAPVQIPSNTRTLPQPAGAVPDRVRIQPPAPSRTRTEKTPDGRARLTNDIYAAPSDDWQR